MKRVLFLILISFGMTSFVMMETSDFKFLVINKLNQYTATSYPEKVYVHTDKPYYAAGDDIWFNTYLVNGVTHHKSNKSKVIYVELINESDSLLSTRKLFTETNHVQGDFQIPSDAMPGNYMLRAYTNYMQNQDQSYFFQKEIPVFELSYINNAALYDAEITPSTSADTSRHTTQPEVNFYPEGGYLTEGLSTKVAVKIEDQTLLNGDNKGYIEDSDGNIVTDFKTFEFGLGAFFLKPEPNKTYQAIIETKQGEIVYTLPNILKQGYVMSVSTTSKDLLIDVQSNIKNGLEGSFIIGHQRGAVAFERYQKDQRKRMLVKIPKDKFTSGVLEITLFDKNEKPVAERLIYVDNINENVDVSINANADNYQLREKVNLNIAIKSVIGDAVPSTLSLAVRDIDAIPQDQYAENIKTWLLLNSDLRGKIESPGFFFQQDEVVKRSYLLDLVMLTHGWRRFTWQELLNENRSLQFKAEKGMYIKGVTVSTDPPYSQIVANTKLTFKREDGLYQEVQRTASDGTFDYGPFVHHKPIDIVLEASTDSFSLNNPIDRASIGLIIQDTTFRKTAIRSNNGIKRPKISPVALKEFLKQSQNIAESRYLFDNNRELLNEITIEAKRKSDARKKDIARNKRTRYGGNPSHRIIVEELGATGAVNFLDLLANLPGVYVRASINSSSNEPEVRIRGLKPSFYLNGSEVPLDFLLGLKPVDIDFIDVLKGSSALAFGLEAQGVIIVYTNRGRSIDTQGEVKKSSTQVFKSPGFYTAREFYAPNYALEYRRENHQDLRSTLHWEANINTSTKKNAEISFYTCDEKGTYMVEIEGITNTGIPFHKTATFEVE